MLKVNVGLSRKIGEAGYSSRGGAVHLEAELDGGLAAEPARLQDRIRHLFGLARLALAAELQQTVPPSTNGAMTPVATVPSPTASAALPAATTISHTTPARNSVRMATPAQVKAIYGLAHSKAVAVRDFTDHHCGVSRPDDLTLRQASQLIDELKALPEPIPTAYGETVQESF